MIRITIFGFTVNHWTVLNRPEPFLNCPEPSLNRCERNHDSRRSNHLYCTILLSEWHDGCCVLQMYIELVEPSRTETIRKTHENRKKIGKNQVKSGKTPVQIQKIRNKLRKIMKILKNKKILKTQKNPENPDNSGRIRKKSGITGKPGKFRKTPEPRHWNRNRAGTAYQRRCFTDTGM